MVCFDGFFGTEALTIMSLVRVCTLERSSRLASGRSAAMSGSVFDRTLHLRSRNPNADSNSIEHEAYMNERRQQAQTSAKL